MGLIFKFCIATVIATILGLTAHILILDLVSPSLGQLSAGHEFTSARNYSIFIKCWAYLTGAWQVGIIAIVYYYTGNLIKSKLVLKILILTFFKLELSGSLIRMTVMNIIVAHSAGIKSPIEFGILSQVDQWCSALLLISSLVLFCPMRKYEI